MFDGIRKGLIEAYLHKEIEGHKCAICGDPELKLCLHVIEYYHPDSVPTPPYFVPMSRSRGQLRGSVPICERCCPPCKKCKLPIATKWIKKVKAELYSLHPGISFSIGNGFCHDHIHIKHDIAAVFKGVRLNG